MTTTLARRTDDRLAVSDELGLAGRLQGNHYVLPPNTSVEAWLTDGEVLQAMEKRVGFWLGDWLRAGEVRYGPQLYTQALKSTGHAYQTLKNAKRVAGKFPAETRIHPGLAFGHYDAVAGLPPEDADELLQEASATKLSTMHLRERAKFRQAQIRDADRATLPVPVLDLPEVRLLVGDATDLALEDDLVDLIVTSPPYALQQRYEGGDEDPVSWVKFIRAACAEAYRVAKPGARFALNVPIDTTLGGCRPTGAQAVASAMACGWEYRSTIVWIDGELGRSTARGSYDQERQTGTAQAPSIIAPAETIILFSKGPWWRAEPPDRPSDIDHDDWVSWTNGYWTFPGESNPWETHPATFPEELPRRLIHLLSFPGDLVLDPFLGSGTTAVVARALGRAVIGVDSAASSINCSTRRLAADLAKYPNRGGF